MASSQQAVRIRKFDAENWQKTISIDEIPIPEPSASQALVKIKLRPVNPSDMLAVQGVYAGFQPESFPATPGMEGLGEIVKSAGKFKKGQRVVGAPWPADKGYGTYQEYYVTEEENLRAVPDGVSDEAAASFWINPVTVVGMLRVLDAPKGSYILQSAAGSSLGRQLIATAKSYGLKTINFVRRSEQKQELLDIGADVVIGTDETPDFEDEVKKITGREGAWGGIDPVGGEMTGKLLSSVKSGGKILVYGVLSGLTATVQIPDLLFSGKSIHGFWLVPWFKGLSKEDKEDVLQEMFRLLEEKVINEFKSDTFDLKDVVKALEATNKTGNTGKGYIQS